MPNQQHPEKRWIPCRVFPGMFSDEIAVEVKGHSFFVGLEDVRNIDEDRGEVRVTIVQADGLEWAVIPTSSRESVPLGA